MCVCVCVCVCVCARARALSSSPPSLILSFSVRACVSLCLYVSLLVCTVPTMLVSTNPYDYPRQRLPRYPTDLLEEVNLTETIFQAAQQPAMFSREDEVMMVTSVRPTSLSFTATQLYR